jgi:hypothetical protein
MPRHQNKLKLKLKIAQCCILETLFRNKIYMPNASPSPNQIVIQKISAVIIRNPNFFLKLIICPTRSRKGEKIALKLEFLTFNLKK